MSDRVLVTGISGFLGGHVALALLNQGHKVRGSLRDLKRADHVCGTLARHGADTSGLEFVALDLLSDEGWDEAMRGVRYVQHVASPFVLAMPKDPGDLIRPAVGGVERALTAAFRADVERVVLTSSLVAMIYGHDPARTEIFTDRDWTNLDSPLVSAYARSKTLAERRAWEIAEKMGRTDDLVAVNPSVIYGPLLDRDPGTSGLLIQRLLRGDMPGVPRMMLPSVDVRDVATVQVAAMTNTQAGGRRLPTSAGSMSLLEISDTLREAFPQFSGKLPRRQLPDWFVRIYALFDKQVRDNRGEMTPNERRICVKQAASLLDTDFIAPRAAVVATGHSLIGQGLI